MIDVIIFDSIKKELQLVHKTAYELSARMSEADWDWHLYSEPEKLTAYLDRTGNADFSCMDVAAPQGVDLAERVRNRNAAAFILLIADETVSPMRYLKPSVLPGALLLRPFSAAQALETVKTAMAQMLRSADGPAGGGVFQLNLKTERKMIPYSQICYFEAREKKIFVNTGNQEYSFYDTIDHLQEQLPAGFLRCHRSFIVSKSKIENVYLSKNYMELENGMIIPLSRSYKAALKELK